MLRLLAWFPLAVLVAAAATRALGEDGPLFLVVLHALLPWVLLFAWPALAAGVLARRWLVSGVAAALVAAHIGWTAAWFDGPVRQLDSPSAAPGGAHGPVRLLSVNLFAQNPRSAQVARTLRAADADIIFLQELTPQQHRALASFGAFSGYPYAVADPRLGSSGSAIYSRLPLEEGAAWPVVETVMTRAVLVARSTRVQLVNVHTTSPFSGTRAWNAELAALAALVRETAGPVVLAGDFNATDDHVGMRRILEAGTVDAHDVTGREEALTWPWNRRRLPPLVRIDRVLVGTGVRVRRAGELSVPGSDHRAVMADLDLPAG